MSTVRTSLTLFFALLLGALPAHADPRIGERLPPLEIGDLLGHPHTTAELAGRPTLVLAMTQVDAEEAMRAWGRAADARLPTGTRRVALVILELAFFIPQDIARAKARPRTPINLWVDTWFDAHRDPGDAALLKSDLPYVFALDQEGRIVAEAHALVTDASAEAIWAAFGAQ